MHRGCEQRDQFGTTQSRYAGYDFSKVTQKQIHVSCDNHPVIPLSRVCISLCRTGGVSISDQMFWKLHKLIAGGKIEIDNAIQYSRDKWKKRYHLPNTAVITRPHCFKNTLLLLGLCLFIVFKLAFLSYRKCKFLPLIFKDPYSSVLLNVLKYVTSMKTCI